MIISDEQVMLAAQCLRERPHTTSVEHDAVPSDLVDAVRRVLADAPETRSDRVAEAQTRLRSGVYDSHEVANKLIGRVVSDALR